MLVARGVLHVVHLISFSLFALLLKYPYPSRSMHPVRQTGIHQDLEDPSRRALHFVARLQLQARHRT